MAFREISVVQIKEALRLSLRGSGERTIAQAAGIDRKTVHRYIESAKALGLDRAGDESQITDELIGQLVEKVRPQRLRKHVELLEFPSRSVGKELPCDLRRIW